MKARILAVLTATAAAVLSGAPPAVAAPAIRFTELSFDTDHVDTTQGPAFVELHFTVADSDPDGWEISGLVELRQFDGATAIGPPTVIPYDAQLIGSTSATNMFVYVPQYGASPEAVWRVTRVTAHDGRGNERVLRGDALAAFDEQFGVTQLVDADEPVLDEVTLWPGQPAEVVDPGTGVTVNYRVVVTDLEAGLWKGRLVLAGPDGRRLSTAFAVASDGRHLTCGTGSLINDIYDHVECFVPVPIPAAGAWTVHRVALTDRAENTRLLNRPAGPVVTVTRG